MKKKIYFLNFNGIIKLFSIITIELKFKKIYFIENFINSKELF